MNSINQTSSVALDVPNILRSDITRVNVSFINFDGIKQNGTIEVHQSIASDIQDAFDFMKEISFPMQSISLIENFGMSDDVSMEANNSYAFCFRTVALKPQEISLHGYGLAVDLNPLQNPYINESRVLPPNAIYSIDEPGTLYRGHPVVDFFKERGFIWGGDWDKSYKDYQHFHKPLSEELREKYALDIKNLRNL